MLFEGIPILLADTGLPAGKAFLMLVFFGPVALFASAASFSPNRLLLGWAPYIGTKNPHVARIVCILAALLGWFAVAAASLSLAGVEI